MSWMRTLGTGEKGERDMLSELSWWRSSRFSPGLLARLRLSSFSLLRCCLRGGEEGWGRERRLKMVEFDS